MNLYSKTFTPMLLKEIKKPFNDKNYIFELKFDGIRVLIYANPKNINIISRNGQNLTSKFPELLSIKNLVKDKCIFDGELVVLENGIPNFKKIMARTISKKQDYLKSPVSFVCFDIIYKNKDLTNLPLIKRKEILNTYPDTDNFIKIKYIKEQGTNLFKIIKQKNLEGIIAKKIESKYHINKRTDDWVKIKNIKTDDFYILGYKEGNINSSILLGKKENNNLVPIGKVSIGTNSNAFILIKKQKELNSSLSKDYTYIIPNLKCEIDYLEYTKNKKLRHPVFRRLI